MKHSNNKNFFELSPQKVQGYVVGKINSQKELFIIGGKSELNKREIDGIVKSNNIIPKEIKISKVYQSSVFLHFSYIVYY